MTVTYESPGNVAIFYRESFPHERILDLDSTEDPTLADTLTRVVSEVACRDRLRERACGCLPGGPNLNAFAERFVGSI